MITTQNVIKLEGQERFMETYVKKSFLGFSYKVKVNSGQLGKDIQIFSDSDIERVYLNGKVIYIKGVTN